MASPGLEPETFSVLDWRDNQLHHDTLRWVASKIQVFLDYFAVSLCPMIPSLHYLVKISKYFGMMY